MPGAKWLVANFENPAKQLIQNYGYWGIRRNEWESFTKLYTRKCLIGRIEINNWVNNDWWSCKKKFLAALAVITVLASWLLDISKCVTSNFAHDINTKCLVTFKINEAWQYSAKTLPRHQVSTSNSNFRKIPAGVRYILTEIFDPLQKFTTVAEYWIAPNSWD